MLGQLSFIPPFSIPNISYCACRYYYRAYTESAFQRYKVDQPATLSTALPKRKSEYLAGRYCAMLALSNMIGGDSYAGKLQVAVNDDRSPRWPDGLVGSISHSSNAAVAIVARCKEYRGLGIDCEVLLSTSEARTIQDYVLHRKDLAYQQKSKLDIAFFTTLAFSAKESLYKAIYSLTTEVPDFQDIQIIQVTADSLTLRLLKTLDSSWVSGTDFEVFYAKKYRGVMTVIGVAV